MCIYIYIYIYDLALKSWYAIKHNQTKLIYFFLFFQGGSVPMDEEELKFVNENVSFVEKLQPFLNQFVDAVSNPCSTSSGSFGNKGKIQASFWNAFMWNKNKIIIREKNLKKRMNNTLYIFLDGDRPIIGFIFLPL